MTTGDNFDMYVPMEWLYAYMNSPSYKPYKGMMYSIVLNVGTKSNYKKFAKRLKKAVKYLPEGLEVVVRAERK